MLKSCFLRSISLVILFACTVYAEDMPVRIRVEPVETISMSTVTTSTAQFTFPNLRGRKEILVRNTSTTDIVYLWVSPNYITMDSAWEIPANNFIKLSVSSDNNIKVSSNTTCVLKVIQIK